MREILECAGCSVLIAWAAYAPSSAAPRLDGAHQAEVDFDVGGLREFVTPVAGTLMDRCLPWLHRSFRAVDADRRRRFVAGWDSSTEDAAAENQNNAR